MATRRPLGTSGRPRDQRHNWFVGCSGWHYPDWRGPFYPESLPPRHWLAHYATVFDTVEANSTFYRLPSHEAVAAWATQLPAGFVMSVKLGAFGSHRMKLADPAPWIARHVERFGALGSHLGPTLVQLPPRWNRDVARLDAFLSAASDRRRHHRLRWAVELRDPSWIHDDTLAVLREHGAALCLHDKIEQHPMVLTTDWTYVRFHGPQAHVQPYRFRYSDERLDRWVARLAEWVASDVDCYVYFNNDVGAAAPHDALALRRKLTAALDSQR